MRFFQIVICSRERNRQRERERQVLFMNVFCILRFNALCLCLFIYFFLSFGLVGFGLAGNNGDVGPSGDLH